MRSDDITIPKPCHANWDEMRPEQRGRFCFDCRKKVHDLSAMTEAEAERFMEAEAERDICVSYEHDDDGQIRFRAPVVPLSRLRRRAAAAAAVAGAGLAATLAACTPHGEGPKIRDAETRSFSAPSVVIPHASSTEPPAVEPPSTEPPAVVDEPCDTVVEQTPPVIDRPRVKGRRVPLRTAGKPVMRKMGAKVATKPTL